MAVGAPIAFALGALIVTDTIRGVTLLIACVAGIAVLIDLPVGIAIWAFLIFMRNMPGGGGAENALSVLIVIAWLAAATSRVPGTGRTMSPQFAVPGALFLVWIFISVAWAGRTEAAFHEARDWYIAAAACPVIATAGASVRNLRLIITGFVLGALCSVAIGLPDLLRAADATSRFVGAEGDPNDLAAGLVPAIVLACVLLVGVRSWLVRLGLFGVIAALAIGLAATQSRGGAVAALVAALAALFVFRHRLAMVLTLIALAGGVVVAFAATQPGTLERITDFSDGGSGRADLWRVSLRMTRDHPLLGVGLGNFTVESPAYVQEPGELTAVGLIVDAGQRTHNAYLQMLAETGVVGLSLFLLVLASALSIASLAARRLRRVGEWIAADLVRGVVVATIGMLGASAFLSNGFDKRLWMLLALGAGALVSARPAESSERRR